MDTNPKILQIKEICQEGRGYEIEAWVKSLDPRQVANYVKMALLHPDRYPEIWKVLPYVDPNTVMYGGDLLGNTLSHGGISDVPPDRFNMGIEELVAYGANPNSTFAPAEAGEGVSKTDIFSLAILANVLKPPTFRSLAPLLGILCDKGLNIEGNEQRPPRIIQLTQALRPSLLLESRNFNKRKEVAKAAGENWSLTEPNCSAGPIEGLQQQTRDLYGILLKSGAKHEDYIEAKRLLRSYHDMLDGLRHNPDALKAELGKEFKSEWHQPEFVIDRSALEDARRFYTMLEMHIARETGTEPYHKRAPRSFIE